MAINDTDNDAEGKDPEFGAIFMSNSGRRGECFKRRIFGLPLTEIHFVEKIKAGMVLFLFEYDKRHLHGVFKASCDGGINLEPNAFASLGKQYPAQVKFIPIWSCKPLPENLFRDAIRENYFSPHKFNFGLSKNQVRKLLCLFSSTRKLELEVPCRSLTRTEDLKSEQYLSGKAGRSVDHGKRVKNVQNKQHVDDDISPIMRHKCQGDSFRYNGEDEYIRLNAGDIAVIKHGRGSQLAVDSTGGYVCDYFASKDRSGFTAHENEDYMASCLRPNIIGGYSRSPSDKIRVHSDGRLSISDRFLGEDLRKTDQRMAFSDDISDIHNSNVNQSVLYRKSNLELDSSVQNQIRPTSTMLHPIQTQILNSSSAALEDGSSKSTTLLYDPDIPALNFSQSSSLGISAGAKSVRENISLSNNYFRNTLSGQPGVFHPDVKDMNRWHGVGDDFRNSDLYSGNRDFMPLSTAPNSDQLAAESVTYEAFNLPSLKYSSCPIPPSDIGNRGRLHDQLAAKSVAYDACIPSLKYSSSPIPSDIGNSGLVLEPFSSLFHNHQSSLGDNVHSTTSLEDMAHELALPRSYETFIPDVSWANEGHSPDGNPVIQEYGIGCYSDSQNNNTDYPKKKRSVFSRLSFMQDIKNAKSGNDAWNEEYDFQTSVDEVMERVCLSHNQWLTRRKPNPRKAESLRDKSQIIRSRIKGDYLESSLSKPEKAESSRDKSQITSSRIKDDCFESTLNKKPKKAKSLRDNSEIISSRTKGDCFEFTLTSQGMDLITTSGGDGKKAAEDVCFVDFKRRSKVRKLIDDYEIRSYSESESSLPLQQKRRKLIRPNFSKSSTSGDKGVIDLGASQNLQDGSYSCNVKDVNQSHFPLVQAEANVKADAEVQNSVDQTHSDDKKSCNARGYACNKGGSRAIGDDALIESNDGSKWLERLSNPKAFSSALYKDKTCHIKQGSCVKDNIQVVSLDTEVSHSICQELHVDNIICTGRGSINTEDEMPKDCSSSFSIAVKDGTEYLPISGNEKATIETSCPMKEVLLVMDSIKPVSSGTDSPHSISSGRGCDFKEDVPKDGKSFLAEVKDGSDSLQNTGNENASIVTTCFKEICQKKSGSESESLHATCQERCVDKVICAGGAIKTEEGMPKDGSSSSTTEVKGGSDCSHKSGNDNVPIATFEQKMA